MDATYKVCLKCLFSYPKEMKDCPFCGKGKWIKIKFGKAYLFLPRKEEAKWKERAKSRSWTLSSTYAK